MRATGIKGRKAVLHARKYLEALGFICSEAQHECANGHDLVAIKNGRGFTFEVKPALYRNRAYLVKKISRISSDGVLICFPSGYIRIDSMKDHLALCTKDGTRFLTFNALVVATGDAVRFGPK